MLHMFLAALIAELVQDAAPVAALRLSFGVTVWIPGGIVLLDLLATVAASTGLKGVVAPTGDNAGLTFTAAATLHRRMWSARLQTRFRQKCQLWGTVVSHPNHFAL